MEKNNNKKAIQLGMPIGTASGKLRKSIVFMLLKMLNLNFCFQCGSEIESENELSIEHKKPYLDSEDPIKLFFDLNNIAFSHLLCNIGAARKTKPLVHGTNSMYHRSNCSCDPCKKAHSEYNNKWNKEKRKRSQIDYVHVT